MNRKFAMGILAVLGFVTICAPIYAHHGGASYDATKSITLKGTVTDYLLSNPHAQIYFDVKDENGNVTHWAAELNAPSWLIRKGWTRNSMKVGDEITLVAHPNKDPNVHVISPQKVMLPGGQELDNGQPQ